MTTGTPHRLAALGVVAVGALLLSACGSDPTSQAVPDQSAGSCPSGTLNAEGSSAQKNAIDEAIASYQSQCEDVTITYNPTGSGDGIKQFNAGQVDFAGSDASLKTEADPGQDASEADQAAKRCGGNPAWNLPMVVGPIAVAYNVPGVDDLILDGKTAAKVFAGTIKKWNDPAIAALNPDAKLPDKPIVVFFRSDDSGTTENFTRYLQASSAGVWTDEPSKTWPGAGSGKSQSAGVAQGVKSTPGSITYVEWSYARDNKLSIARIDNGSGPVTLSAQSAGKAVTSAKPAASGHDLALNLDYATSAKGAYPIILVTYEIVCSKGLDAKATTIETGFLQHFASEEFQSTLEKIGYAPLPDSVRAKVNDAIKAVKK